jgi:hypothetical protein
MKDLFNASDEMYKAGLALVNKVASLEGALPDTKRLATVLAEKLANYERSRFQRRKIIVEFEAPMPRRELSRRELSDRRKLDDLRCALNPERHCACGTGIAKVDSKKKDGDHHKTNA